MISDGLEVSTIPEVEAEVTEIEPAGEVAVINGPKQLSQSDIRAYAKATGKTILTLKDMSRRAVLGDLVQKLGAAKMGSSMLIDSEKMIKDGIEQCDEMMETFKHIPEIVTMVVKCRLGFVDLWVRVAQAHIKSRKDYGPDISDMKPLAMAFPPAATVQNNVQVNLVGSEKPQA